MFCVDAIKHQDRGLSHEGKGLFGAYGSRGVSIDHHHSGETWQQEDKGAGTAASSYLELQAAENWEWWEALNSPSLAQ